MRWPVLTRQEKNIVAFVVIVFVLGLAVKVYRQRHPHVEAPKRERPHGTYLQPEPLNFAAHPTTNRA